MIVRSYAVAPARLGLPRGEEATAQHAAGTGHFRPSHPLAPDAAARARACELIPPDHGARRDVDAELRDVCRTSLDALLVVDDARRHVRVNQAAAELLGAPAAEVLGRRIEDFTPPEHHRLLDDLWAALRAKGTLHGDFEILCGDGSRRLVEFRAMWDFGPREHLIAARSLYSTRERHARQARLTRREREILQLASDGLTVSEIAARVLLSPETVKTHFKNVYTKLAARDRTSAVAEALRRSLIK